MPPEEFPGWRVLEDIGAGDGIPTGCGRYGKPESPGSSFSKWA